MSKRIVVFGNERIATGVTTTNPILRQLIEDGYDIAAVVVNNETQAGTHKVRRLEIAELAAEHGIPLLAPRKLSDIAEELRGYHAEAGVLVAYGRIVAQSIIAIFPRGIINIHPSLLPKHRGPTPLESAILAGDLETGVSLMKLAKEMDAGPIFAQTSVQLDSQTQKQSLADSLLEISASMLHELLPGILDGSVIAMPQHEQSATYDALIDKQDGIIDWTKSAERIEREIRAYAQWPRSRASLKGLDVIITQAHAVPSTAPSEASGHIEIQRDQGLVMIKTSDDYLCIDRIQPVSKKEMTAAEFIRGYGQRLGP